MDNSDKIKIMELAVSLQLAIPNQGGNVKDAIDKYDELMLKLGDFNPRTSSKKVGDNPKRRTSNNK